MKILQIVALSVALITTGLLEAKTVEIKKETKEYILDVKYPQGFDEKKIDTRVKSLVDIIMKQSNYNSSENDLPTDLPGKNSLYIDYKTQFSNAHALSLEFTVSTYTRGAAHPNNSIQTLNFLNNQPITLDKLFKEDSNFLAKIADHCYLELVKKGENADEKWLTEGTKPTEDNYRNWYFTQDGLAIVFDTYQVAAYVYGPQTILISMDTMKTWLRPEIKQAVWGINGN